MKRSKIKKALVLAGIFITGILLSTYLIRDIAILPYANPWGITGPLTQIKYNPANDIIKFIVIIGTPSIIFLLFFFLLSNKLFDKNRIKKVISNNMDLGMTNSVHDNYKNILLPFIIILAIIVSLNIQTYHNCGNTVDTFHEGETLGPAISIMAGKIPYKDIIFVHGIFQDPLRSVVAFNIFGQSIGASRTLQSIIKVFSFILLVIMLLKLFKQDYLSALISFIVLTIAIYMQFLLIPPRDITTFLTIIFFLILAHLIQTETYFSKIRFSIVQFLFSFMSLVTLGYSIDRGFYLFGAYLLFSPIMFFYFRKKHLTIPFFISSFLGLVTAIIVLGFLLRWDFASFFDFVFLIIPRYKGLFDGMLYPFDNVKYLFPVTIIAFNLFWIIYTLLSKYLNKENILKSFEIFIQTHLIELYLLVLSIFFFRSALSRSDWSHVIYSSALAYILTLFIILKYYLTPFFHKNKRIKKTISILTIISGLIIILSGSYRIYDNNLIESNFPLNKNDSDFIPDNYKKTILFIKNNLKDDESFFTMTSEAIWYYFINKPAPTAFPVIWFAMPEFYQKQVIRDFKNNNIKIVLYKNNFWTNKIDGFTSQERLPLIDDYIRNHYSFLKKIDDNELWVKDSKEH